MSSLVEHAERELKLAGLFDDDSNYGGMLGHGVLELVKVFAEQGHSGGSAGLAIDLFRRVADYKLLTPLENPCIGKQFMSHFDPPILQSTRDFSVFSYDNGKTWYRTAKRNTRWQRFLHWVRCNTSIKVPTRWLRTYVKFKD